MKRQNIYKKGSTNSLPNGVYENSSGNYQVRLWYQGSNHSIGTFQTLEQATLSNKIARNIFKKDKWLRLSPEECERNIKLAKEAAMADAGGASGLGLGFVLESGLRRRSISCMVDASI